MLLNIDSSEYHNLNDVGSRMWQALEESPDVATAYVVLCDTYEVDADKLRDDLGAFIRELIDRPPHHAVSVVRRGVRRRGDLRWT